MAVDPDLRVFNMLHVAICPTTAFVARGGRVSYTTIRPLGRGADRAAPAGDRRRVIRRGPVAAELAAEFPELALFQTTVEARPVKSPRAVKERLRHDERPLHGRQGRAGAPAARAVGVPRLLQADRHRPGRAPHAARGDRARAHARRRLPEPQPARRRHPDRHRGDGRAAARVRPRPRGGRRRPAAGAAPASASGTRGERCAEARSWRPTSAGRCACCSRTRRPTAGSRRPAGACSSERCG